MGNQEINFVRFNLLSIDAWRECEGGWTWNNWFSVEKDIYIAESELTARKLLKYMRKCNWLSNASKGRLSIEDDGYNIIIQNKDTFEPILALCYGEFEQ